MLAAVDLDRKLQCAARSSERVDDPEDRHRGELDVVDRDVEAIAPKMTVTSSPGAASDGIGVAAIL